MRWLDGIIDSMDMSLSKVGVGDGQGGLACCSLWGRKESDTTEQLNNNKQITIGKSYRVTSPIENRLMEKPALCKLKIVS